MASEPCFREGALSGPVGGFASQRLLAPSSSLASETCGFSGNKPGGFAPGSGFPSDGTCAFRIGPAASTPLTAPLTDIPILSDFFAGSDLPTRSRETVAAQLAAYGIFKFLRFWPDGRTFVDNTAFETLGVHYLKDTDGRKLMLLDEIGGHELTCRPFMDALLELLAGDIPCIGVIKAPASTRRMDASLLDLHSQLRTSILETYGGEILYYERGDESVQRKVEQFIYSSLMGTLHE